MKLLFKKILSLQQDGALSFLIIFDEQYKILLDCGINHNFDLTKYRLIADQLRQVQLVLISHSALQYSGAYPFLISELGLNPRIFYTTQPIMRYSPLSIHEELLNLRLPSYNRKVFNRIYAYFQDMQLVKPYQKKEIELISSRGEMVEEKHQSFRKPIQSIQFCCFLAGGYLGSLYWRISYGLVNIIYLVEYNNYSMHHIGGLDFDNLATIPTHLLITDVYPRRDIIKKISIYQEIKQVVLNFYKQNFIDPSKPKAFNSGQDQQLLIVCYPTELIVEILFILRKIVSELQEGGNVERIGVIHLSSRFLELVKSQSEYFSGEFKGMLEKMNQYFEQPQTLDNRINVSSIHSVRGRLAQNSKNLHVYYVGADSCRKCEQKVDSGAHLKSLRLFDEQEERLVRSASKLSMSKIESKEKIEEKMEVQVKGEQMDQELKEEDSNDLLLDDNKFEKKNFKSKYIALISSIPRFNLSKRQKDQQITEFGFRHHTGEPIRAARKTIYQYMQDVKPEQFQEKMLSKKQSKVEIMNIRFELPPSGTVPVQPMAVAEAVKNFHKTEYQSSLRIIHHIRPKDVIFVNMPLHSNLLNNYQSDFGQFRDQGKITAYDSNVKKLCYLSYSNQLLEYKMNYLPQMQQKKVQRVRGTIVKEGNQLRIHLDCLDDSQIASFRLQKFFGLMQSKMRCRFTGIGIEVQKVKIYRKENFIIMEGEYSEEYFKVRKELYEFLGFR